MEIENIANILYELISENCDRLQDISYVALTKDNTIALDYCGEDYIIKIDKDYMIKIDRS